MSEAKFPAYLRGIETAYVHLEGVLTGNPFPAYLRGIETLYQCTLVSLYLKFPAYLRGIETRNLKFFEQLFYLVPSLPTRD